MDQVLTEHPVLKLSTIALPSQTKIFKQIAIFKKEEYMLTKSVILSHRSEWVEWHLTPRGWERGTEKCDNLAHLIKVEPPEDRVLTCRYHQNIAVNSIWLQTHISEIWKSANQEIVNKLLEKFGSCPQTI
ncbi:MAG: hypothetical protein IGS49_13835 [Chlorogloeopsis fritschii C42_A2020_084]|nr:hypothetical protein [Chlorogloeopsis fritschii C42_A2020_084]